MNALLAVLLKNKGKLSFSAALGLAVLLASVRGCQFQLKIDPIKAREKTNEISRPAP